MTRPAWLIALFAAALCGALTAPARAEDYQPTSSFCRTLVAAFESYKSYEPRAFAVSRDGEHCGLCVRVYPCRKIGEGVEAGALFECEDRAARHGASEPACKVVACEGC